MLAFADLDVDKTIGIGDAFRIPAGDSRHYTGLINAIQNWLRSSSHSAILILDWTVLSWMQRLRLLRPQPFLHRAT